MTREHKPLGFGEGGESQVNVVEHIATVRGRGVHVPVEKGEVVLHGQAMVFMKDGEIIVIQGGNPHKLSVDDVNKLLPRSEADQVTATIQKDRKRKKEKIKRVVK